MQKIKEFYKFMPQREFEYHIHISPISNYIYFEVPKVACSTIKATLQELEARKIGREPPAKEMAIIHNKRLSPLKSPSDLGLNKFRAMLDDEAVIKFCFVRNPYTRVLSAYLSKVNWVKSNYNQQIAQILGLQPGKNITFEQFVIAIGKTPPKEMDPHWRNQTHQLFGGLVKYNYIGRFEELNQDFKQILNKIYKEKETINNSGKLTGSNSKIQQYYNQKIQKMVYEIYQEDFKMFNYPEELPNYK